MKQPKKWLTLPTLGYRHKKPQPRITLVKGHLSSLSVGQKHENPTRSQDMNERLREIAEKLKKKEEGNFRMERTEAMGFSTKSAPYG